MKAAAAPFTVRAKKASGRFSISSGVSGPGGYAGRVSRCSSPSTVSPSTRVTRAGTRLVEPQSLIEVIAAWPGKWTRGMTAASGSSAPQLDPGLVLDQANGLEIVGLLAQGGTRTGEELAGEVEHRAFHTGLPQQLSGDPDVLVQQGEAKGPGPLPRQDPLGHE